MTTSRAMETGNHVLSTTYVRIIWTYTKTYSDMTRKTLSISITGFKSLISCANQLSTSALLVLATWLECSLVSSFYRLIQTLMEEGLFSYSPWFSAPLRKESFWSQVQFINSFCLWLFLELLLVERILLDWIMQLRLCHKDIRNLLSAFIGQLNCVLLFFGVFTIKN